MHEHPRVASLWLIIGLVLGSAGTYFESINSKPTDPASANSTTMVAAGNQQEQTQSIATTISTAIQNPTGLRLVGTIVQPEHSRSRAWVLQVTSDTTQAYGEGETLPGGYRLTSIGTENLQVTKDGYSFTIRRSSSSSGEKNDRPCEALAQNAPGPLVNSSPTPHLRWAQPSGEGRGLNGGHRGSQQAQEERYSTSNQTQSLRSQQSHQSQPSQKSPNGKKSFGGWDNKSPVDEDSTIDIIQDDSSDLPSAKVSP